MKIIELENELKKLSETNDILSNRCRLFEKKRNDDAYNDCTNLNSKNINSWSSS